MQLSITPDRFGPNVFTVAAHAQPDVDQPITQVTIATSMLDMAMGADTITLTPAGPGQFSGPGSLSMTGDWQVRVIIHTTDNATHVAVFQLTAQ